MVCIYTGPLSKALHDWCFPFTHTHCNWLPCKAATSSYGAIECQVPCSGKPSTNQGRDWIANPPTARWLLLPPEPMSPQNEGNKAKSGKALVYWSMAKLQVELQYRLTSALVWRGQGVLRRVRELTLLPGFVFWNVTSMISTSVRETWRLNEPDINRCLGKRTTTAISTPGLRGQRG